MRRFDGSHKGAWAISSLALVFSGGCALVLDFADYDVGPGGNAGAGGSASSSSSTSSGSNTSSSTGSNTSSSGSAGAGGNPNCMADLLHDSQNCGSCGTDCLGGTCAQGSCTAVLMSEGVGVYNHLVVYGDYIYWTNEGSIYRLQKDAPPNTPRTTVIDKASADFIAVDETSVYFTVFAPTGTINSVPNGGNGAGVSLASSQYLPLGLTVFKGTLYWVTYEETGTIHFMPKVGGMVMTDSASLVNPFMVRVDTNGTFATYRGNAASLGGVYASSGKNATGFYAPNGLALDDNYYFFLTNDGAIHRAKRSDGAVTLLASPNGGLFAGGVVVDDNFVYWTGAGTQTCDTAPNCGCGTTCGTIYRVLKEGLGIGTLETFALGGKDWQTARDVAVDETAAYWTTGESATTNGKLYRKVKPKL